MAFKLTYSDGQETDYDDDTAWEVEAGVLKMGRQEGEWSVLVSPSHWAVIEVGGQRLADDSTSKDLEDADDSDEKDSDAKDSDAKNSDEKDSDEKKDD